MRFRRPFATADATPWFIFPMAMLLFFWRRGYSVGAGDQDEMLPLILHRLNPEWFANDWFVQSQVGWTIRSYFQYLIEMPAHVVGVPVAVTVLYVAVWLAIAFGVYRLSLEFVQNRTAAVGAVFFALSVALHWTMGGNDLVGRDLTPEMVGWAFALPGVRAFLRDRISTAALWIGVATWFHPLVGMLTALVLGLVLLLDQFDWYQHRLALRQLFTFAIAFVVFASPALVPLAISEWHAAAAATPAEPSAFYILAAFRLPHHHLLHSFNVTQVALFAGLCLGGAVSLVALSRQQRVRRTTFLLRFAGVTAVLCGIGYLFTEVIPVLAVAKMQFFKLTVWIKVLAIILICGWVMTWLGGRTRHVLAAVLDFRKAGWAAVLAGWAVTLGMAIWGVAPVYEKLQPLSHRHTDLYAVERWARERAPVDAVFAVPPSLDSFRYHSRRAIVVNFKSFPFQEPQIYEWYGRLLTLAPITPHERGTGVIPELDRAYHARTAADWRQLAGQFRVDYVVIELRLAEQRPGGLPVFQQGDWAVYRIR